MVQRFLLDTHTLIWALDGGERLGAAVNDAITDPDNAVFVSVVSAWEMAIKRAIGKLDTPDDLAGAVAALGFVELLVTFQHAERAGRLPLLHRDPFDRMLVAQAQAENLTLITGDASIARYAVPTRSAAE